MVLGITQDVSFAHFRRKQKSLCHWTPNTDVCKYAFNCFRTTIATTARTAAEEVVDQTEACAGETQAQDLTRSEGQNAHAASAPLGWLSLVG